MECTEHFTDSKKRIVDGLQGMCYQFEEMKIVHWTVSEVNEDSIK